MTTPELQYNSEYTEELAITLYNGLLKDNTNPPVMWDFADPDTRSKCRLVALEFQMSFIRRLMEASQPK